MSGVDECETQDIQEVGICRKQRMHMSIFRLEDWRKMIRTKRRRSSMKEKRRTVS